MEGGGRLARLGDWLLGTGEHRVMFRWRSSLWKLLWRELTVYTFAFLLLSWLYRYTLTYQQVSESDSGQLKLLTDLQQVVAEKLIRWCRNQSSGLPITFLLGFYVSLVVKRWWEQYCKVKQVQVGTGVVQHLPAFQILQTDRS